MLLDPTSTRPGPADLADPVTPVVLDLGITDAAPATPTVAPEAVALPTDLSGLVARARRDRGCASALVLLLLERGWSTSDVGATLDGEVGLTRAQIEALATVRHPRTSASDVADRLVASHRSRTTVPAPRRG